MKKQFIVIAGNISSGKTTLARPLSKRLKIDIYEEPVQENPFLDDYYAWLSASKKHPRNKKIKKRLQKSSYELQEFYLLNRALDQKKIIAHKKTMIQDRSIYEDFEIFTRQGFKTGTINLKDYIRYRIIYRLLTKRLRNPDLLIYLKASTATLKKRVKMRGNDYEKELIKPKNTYLKELNKRYERFIKKYSKGPKISISTEKYNLRNKKSQDMIVKIVKDHLRKK